MDDVSLRDELLKAQGEIESKVEEVTPVEPVVEQKEEAAPAEKPETQETPAAETPTTESKPAETTESKAALAPAAWSSAAKSKWAELPADIQAEIAKREADVHKEFTRQDGERNFGRSVHKSIEPYMQLIQSEGSDPVTAISSLFNTAQILRTGDTNTKVTLLRNLAQTYNIPLAELSSEVYVDPAVSQLQQRLDRMEFERQQQSQNYQQNALQQEIQAFAAQPGHEHFEALRPVIGSLLQSGAANSLQDAYDQAIWARPDLRSNLLLAEQRKQEEKRLAEAKAKAESAKRAGSSVYGSPGSGSSIDPKAENRSLREELLAQFGGGRI